MPVVPMVNERVIEARVRAILNHWPSIGLALGEVRDGRLAFFSCCPRAV